MMQDRASGEVARRRLRPSWTRALAVASLEASHAATGVEDLLLARVERVALRADLDRDPAGLLGAAGLEGVAATTDDGGRHVVGWIPAFMVSFRMVAGSPSPIEDVNRNRTSVVLARGESSMRDRRILPERVHPVLYDAGAAILLPDRPSLGHDAGPGNRASRPGTLASSQRDY